MYQNLSTRHDWPDKKAVVDLPITLEGNSLTVIRWVRWGPTLNRCIGAAFQMLLIGVTLRLRRRVHKCEKAFSPDFRFSFFLSQHAEKPISKAHSWGGYGMLSLAFCLPIAVGNWGRNTVVVVVFQYLSLSLSFWMLDTSIHRIKWWRKCGHYIHVGVSSARTEKITWPKLGLANFRIILKASAFLLFLNFSQTHCWVWCKMK